MKTNWKLIIAALSSLLLVTSPLNVNSCSIFYQGESYRVGFFTPSVMGDDVFYPFYYSADIMNSMASNFTTDKVRNLKLWQKELGGDIALESIEELLYTMSFNDLMIYKGSDAEKVMMSNPFAIALFKRPDVFDYFSIAKENEFINFQNSDPWGFDLNEEELRADRIKLVNIIKEKLEQTSSAFLKQRYAYLLVVNYHYLKDADNGMAIYKKYFDPNGKDILSNWAFFYSASFLENDVAKNYRWSLAFDKCDSKKARIYNLFDMNLLAATLKMAKNNKERATILSISILNNPAPKMDVIRKINNLDRSNPNLRALILREVSKIEDWLLTTKVTGMEKSVYFSDDNFNGLGHYDEDYLAAEGEMPAYEYYNDGDWVTNYYKVKNYQKDLNYARRFRAYLEGLLATNAYLDKDFLRLAIGHLYFMDDKPQQAYSMIQQVSDKNVYTKVQKAINHVLLLPLTENISSEATKNELYQQLQIVQQNLEHIENPIRTISQLHLYLARQYYRIGDVATASFLFDKSYGTADNERLGSEYYSMIAFFDRYATINDIEQTIALLNKKNPTNFESYLLTKKTPQETAMLKQREYYYEKPPVDKNKKILALIELQGTKAFRDDELEVALSYFSKLPANYWKNNYEFSDYLIFNAFEKGAITNPYDSNKHYKSNNTSYSKKEILTKLIALKNKAESTNDPQLLFELGNAYYNFSYVGNSWMMFSYGKYTYEIENMASSEYYVYSFYPNGQKYFDVFYGSGRAKKYYQKAADASRNVELRAKASFMVIKCQNNREFARGNIEDADDLQKSYKNWSVKYNGTAIHNSLSSNCSTF